MPFPIALALSGLSALSGLFGGKTKNTSDVNNTTTTTPNLTPENQNFQNQLVSLWSSLAGGAGSGDFQKAYTMNGLNNINHTSNINAQSIQDMLASRGLGRTTAGASLASAGSLSSAGRTAGFLNSVPLAMDQRFQDILKSAGSYQSSIPIGQTVHQQGTVANTGTSGGGIGGAIGGGAAGLATILGQQSANDSFAKALKTLGGGGGGTGTLN